MSRPSLVQRRTLVLVGLAVTVWVAPGVAMRAANSGHVTADEPQYLLTAISLGEDLDLDITDERTEQRFRTFHRGELPVQEQPDGDGRLVSPHDPLLPVYLAVPVLVGGWVGAKIALAALAGALAAVLVWIAVVRFRVPPRAAVITVLAFATGAPFAMYGTQVYPEIAAALTVAVAIAVATGSLGRRSVFVLGCCVVALPWLSIKYAPVAGVLAGIGAYRLWSRADRRRLTGYAVGLGAMGALYLIAHRAWYGGWTVYASGDHFTGGELDVVGSSPDYAGRSIRLVGLLTDQDFGLAAWHPLYLLAVPALIALVVRRPPGWSTLMLPLVAGWLTATFVALTMQGWWWPGRQVVVVLPAVVLATAWWASVSRPWVLRTIAVLGAFGAFVFLWLLLEASAGDLRLIVTFEDTSNALVRVWRALLPDYRAATARDWFLHAVWLTAIAVTAFVVARPARRAETTDERQHGRRFSRTF